MIGNFHGNLGGMEICSRNCHFRFSSKSNICLICHCNKINDLLSTDTIERRKLSSTDINEIIHQFRVLNKALDVRIEANLFETLLSPFLLTSLTALKIDNDELRLVVSQALEKVSPNIPNSLLESFLEKLSAQESHQPNPHRSHILPGVAFCSMIKGILYTHSVDLKITALSLINRMLESYKNVADDSCADKTIIADFPSAILQVDLVHFITEAMNTSSETLFRMSLKVLDQITSIPLFRQGRMIPVLESTLRISTMRIPDNISELETYSLLNSFLLNVITSLNEIPSGIQHQIMYLFERLPKSWTASQYLPWIKLLIFCPTFPKFVRFLGSKLHKIDKENPGESVYAHKILTLLIRHQLQECTTLMGSTEGSGVMQPLITWKLTSVLSYMHEIPKVEVWEFIIAIFKINFRCNMIKVDELDSRSRFTNSLLNLLFHLQALTHKVSVKAANDAIWEILCEFLRFASEEKEMVESTFENDVLFQPMMKVTIIHLLASCNNVPSKLSVEPLMFLNKWTKMILIKKLESSTKPKQSELLQILVFGSYVELFKTIRDAMKNDRSQAPPKPSEKTSQCFQPQPVQMSHIFDIDKKTRLIRQIARNCDSFLILTDDF